MRPGSAAWHEPTNIIIIHRYWPVAMEDPSVIAPAALQSTPCADAPWGGWLHAIETQVKHFDGKTSKTVYTHQVPIEGLAVSAIGDNLVVVSINDSVGEVFYWKMAPANTDPRYTHINNANTAWAEINPVKVPLESRARVTAIAWIRQDLISVGTCRCVLGPTVLTYVRSRRWRHQSLRSD